MLGRPGPDVADPARLSDLPPDVFAPEPARRDGREGDIANLWRNLRDLGKSTILEVANPFQKKFNSRPQAQTRCKQKPRQQFLLQLLTGFDDL